MKLFTFINNSVFSCRHLRHWLRLHSKGDDKPENTNYNACSPFTTSLLNDSIFRSLRQASIRVCVTSWASGRPLTLQRSFWTP